MQQYGTPITLWRVQEELYTSTYTFTVKYYPYGPPFGINVTNDSLSLKYQCTGAIFMTIRQQKIIK